MNHTGNRHLWLVLLCCLIPVAALGAIFLFNVPVSSALFVGILLLCPILHLWMMKGMRHHAHDRETWPEMQASITEDK